MLGAMSRQLDEPKQHIPQQWIGCMLGDIVTSSDYGTSESTNEVYGYPVLRMGNLIEGRVRTENLVYLEMDEQTFKKLKLSKGDLLFNRTNSYDLVGKVSIFDLDGDYTFASYLIRLVVDQSKVVPEFVNYFMNMDSSQQQIRKYATKGVQQVNVNITTLKEHFEIQLPARLQEQKKIVEILSVWDRAIELKKELIIKKNEHQLGLMQNLLTGKVRCNDGVKFTKSEVQQRLDTIRNGEIPKGYKMTKMGIIPSSWSVKKLHEVADRVQRQKNGDMVPVLTISSLSGFLEQSDRFSKVIAGDNLSKYVLLEKNEFAYNKGNSKTYPYGCVFRLENYEKALVPNVYYCFRIKNEFTDFYKHYFSAGRLNSGLSRVINTGVRNDGLLNLDVDDFFDLPVIEPPLEEQEHIASVLSAVTNELALLESELEALKQQKKGLMQRLLSGKVRVQF